MHFPGQLNIFINVAADANPNAVLIMQSGPPVTNSLVMQSTLLSICWYGGNETGNAIANVIFWEVNPSGRLQLSWPVNNEDSPGNVFVGYKRCEKGGKKVAFPFGRGLSYQQAHGVYVWGRSGWGGYGVCVCQKYRRNS